MAWAHKNRPAIPKLQPLAKPFNNRVARPELKRADPVYLLKQYEVWRKLVIERAGGRCQAVDDGLRCRKAAPDHRMFADHIQEIQDNGAVFDPANGQALCGSHHTIKTMRERAKRFGGRG